MNRPDISRLSKNRSIFLKVGFLMSLSMVILAFNVTVYEYENKSYITEIAEDVFVEKMIRTHQEKKKKLPPPDFKLSDNIIDEDPDFIEDPLPDPIDTEVNVDTQIIRPRPLVKMERTKPVVIVPAVEEESGNEPFIIVEDMPRFPGCEDVGLTKKEKKTCADKALLKYIYSKIKYPIIASQNGIEGTVVLDFIVEKTGKISNIKILKEIGGGCGNEVLKVVNDMPDWTSGQSGPQYIHR